MEGQEEDQGEMAIGQQGVQEDADDEMNTSKMSVEPYWPPQEVAKQADGDDEDVGDVAEEHEDVAEETPGCCSFDQHVLGRSYDRYGGVKTGNTGSMDGTGTKNATHKLVETMERLGFFEHLEKTTIGVFDFLDKKTSVLDIGSGTGVLGGHLGTYKGGGNLVVLGVESVPERVRVANATLGHLPDDLVQALASCHRSFAHHILPFPFFYVPPGQYGVGALRSLRLSADETNCR